METDEAKRARIVAIVQARTSSTRLPGKVLAPIGSVCMIERLLSQLSGAQSLNLVVVATSVDPSDDELARRVSEFGVPVFRGDLQDVLGRYCAAAEKFDADIVVRITGDCPLHTPDTVDDVVTGFLAAHVDYASNVDPYSRPNGLDVEVISRHTLEAAARTATEESDREHVTPFIRRSVEFRKLRFLHANGVDGKPPRWTVDTQADLDFARAVWERLDMLGPGPHDYATVESAAAAASRRPPDELANRGYLRSLYQQSQGRTASELSRAMAESLRARRAWLKRAADGSLPPKVTIDATTECSMCFERGAGPLVWDVDGNRYVDLSVAMLDAILGYANAEVDSATNDSASKGQVCSTTHPLEVELAERFADLLPSAEAVRFFSDERDALTTAIQAARRHTRRDRIVICEGNALGPPVPYPMHADRAIWLSGCSPNDVICTDPEGIETLLADDGRNFAAVILAPWDVSSSTADTARQLQDSASQSGSVFVLDESCTSFHFGLGGAQLQLGIRPDVTVFGRGIANGYPISCVVGTAEVVGGPSSLIHDRWRGVSLMAVSAAIAVWDILVRRDAYRLMAHSGRMLSDGLRALVVEARLESILSISGPPTLPQIRFVQGESSPTEEPAAFWREQMRNRGALVGERLHVSAALDFASVEHVLVAAANTLKCIRDLPVVTRILATQTAVHR